MNNTFSAIRPFQIRWFTVTCSYFQVKVLIRPLEKIYMDILVRIYNYSFDKIQTITEKANQVTLLSHMKLSCFFSLIYIPGMITKQSEKPDNLGSRKFQCCRIKS